MGTLVVWIRPLNGFGLLDISSCEIATDPWQCYELVVSHEWKVHGEGIEGTGVLSRVIPCAKEERVN